MKEDFASLMGHWTQEKNESDLKAINEYRLQGLLSIMKNELTTRQEFVVREHLINNRPLCDIARELSVNKSTATRHYQKGLERLKQFAQYMK